MPCRSRPRTLCTQRMEGQCVEGHLHLVHTAHGGSVSERETFVLPIPRSPILLWAVHLVCKSEGIFPHFQAQSCILGECFSHQGQQGPLTNEGPTFVGSQPICVATRSASWRLSTYTLSHVRARRPCGGYQSRLPRKSAVGF
jgi:hypothetical protein